MGEFNQSIKNAFSKVKEDMSELSKKIDFFEEKIFKQEDKIREIIDKLDIISKHLQSIKEGISIGNQGVDQSINRSIDQSIDHQSDGQSIDQSIVSNEEIKLPEAKKYSSTRNRGPNRSIDQSINHQSIDQSSIGNLDSNIDDLKNKLDSIFFQLSKQELKLFLLIYQLEDEDKQVTTQELSLRMELSEACIRGHLSSLLRKGAPIIKKRIGSRTLLLSISSDFRNLSLKKRLINLFYDSNPSQKTLFNF